MHIAYCIYIYMQRQHTCSQAAIPMTILSMSFTNAIVQAVSATTHHPAVLGHLK